MLGFVGLHFRGGADDGRSDTCGHVAQILQEYAGAGHKGSWDQRDQAQPHQDRSLMYGEGDIERRVGQSITNGV